MIPRLIATMACLFVLSIISSFGYAATNAVTIGSGGIIFPDNSVQQKASVLPICSSGDVLVNSSGSWYCGKVMPVDKGIITCVGSSCAVSGCILGYGDCDGIISTGCETTLTTTSNCGACNVHCPASTACKTYACTSSTCTPTNATAGTVCTGGVCNGSGDCIPAVTCGDGVISGTEQCDDGNAVSLDGCSSTCQVEPSSICTGSPSSCIRIGNSVNWCQTFYPNQISAAPGGMTSVYGHIYQVGMTEPAGSNASINAKLAYGPFQTNPLGQPAGWTFVNAIFNNQVGNNDEYVAQLIAPATGIYSYAYLFSADNGASYTICDLDGTQNGVDVSQFGVMTVTP